MSETDLSATDLGTIVATQRRFFLEGRSRSLAARVGLLRQVRACLLKHQDRLIAALAKDLSRPPLESFYTEVLFVEEELRHAERSLQTWSSDKEVPSPLLIQPGRSFIRPEPKGVVLIIAPWNYPLQLSLVPALLAIAAGNTVVIKPSELAPESASAVAALVAEACDPAWCTVVEGDARVAGALLEQRWDHIFFTGGSAIATKIMAAAVPTLTPVTLELGGKSPAFVTSHANVKHAARRIAWSKTVNAGQSCVAVDYALVEQKVVPAFLAAYEEALSARLGVDPKQSTDFGRIINPRHHERLTSYLGQGKVALGGQNEAATKYIAPTVLTEVDLAQPVMQEEIFGPILPVISVADLGAALEITTSRPRPLAMYIFSDNEKERRMLLSGQTSGGAVVNDTMYQLANPNLPFGGIGGSGFGAYHGQFGFDLFSHQRAIMERHFHFENPLMTPPYNTSVSGLRRWVRLARFFD